MELTGISALYGGEMLSLGPLPTKPSYELFARIAGRKRCAQDSRATAALAELCGRLPLALRIAAANFASRPGMGIGTYAEDLAAGDRLAKLRTRGVGGVAVRAAFDVSYTALDQPTRRAFCLLGTNPGADVSVAGAAALLGCQAEAARELLDGLTASSLLENQTPERYRFHDLLRLYAGDRARADVPRREQESAFRRLADWYLHSAHAAVMKSMATLYVSPLASVPHDVEPEVFSSDRSAAKWLGDERANYLSVIEHAAVNGPEKYAWLITDAIRPHLLHLFRMVELERIANLGLECARGAGVRRGEAVMYLVLGNMKSLTERPDESLADLAVSRRIAMEIDDRGVLAAALASLSALYGETGLFEKCAEAAQEVLELVDMGVEQGERRCDAATYQLAEAALHLGDPRESKAIMESMFARVRRGPVLLSWR